jgi:hypothetical protein
MIKITWDFALMIFDEEHKKFWHPVPRRKRVWFMTTDSQKTAEQHVESIKQKIKEKKLKCLSVIARKNLVVVKGTIGILAEAFGAHFDSEKLVRDDALYNRIVFPYDSEFVPQGKRGSLLFIKDRHGAYKLWKPFHDGHRLRYRYEADTTAKAAHIVKNLNRSGVGKVSARANYVYASLEALQKIDALCEERGRSKKPKAKGRKAPPKAEIERSTEGPATKIQEPELHKPEFYWYEDTEMNLILSHTLANHGYSSASGVAVHVKGPYDNLSPYGLKQALADHGKKDGILLVPFNLGLLHWVGLELIYSGGILRSANYYDPMRNKVPNFLNLILEETEQEITAWTAIKDSRLIRQTNDSDCGPCTIESLLAAVGYKEPATTAAERRTRHLDLLALTEPEFHLEFFIRQATRESSFSTSEHSKKLAIDAQYHLGVSEYVQLMKLALAVLTTEVSIKDAIIAALKLPFKKTIESLRTCLSENKHSAVIYDIAKLLFYFDSIMDLGEKPPRINSDQIEILCSILTAFTAEELQAQLTELNEPALGFIPGLTDPVDDEALEGDTISESSCWTAISTTSRLDESPLADITQPSPPKRRRLETRITGASAIEDEGIPPYSLMATRITDDESASAIEDEGIPPYSLMATRITNDESASAGGDEIPPPNNSLRSSSDLSALSLFAPEAHVFGLTPPPIIIPSKCGVGTKRARFA